MFPDSASLPRCLADPVTPPDAVETADAPAVLDAPVAPPASVAQLLSASHLAHKAAQKARSLKDFVSHWQSLSEAYERRKDADALDPEHLDAAWAAETVKRFNHAELIAFYTRELETRLPEGEALTREQITERVTVPDGMAVEDSQAFRCLCREHGV